MKRTILKGMSWGALVRLQKYKVQYKHPPEREQSSRVGRQAWDSVERKAWCLSLGFSQEGTIPVLLFPYKSILLLSHTHS